MRTSLATLVFCLLACGCASADEVEDLSRHIGKAVAAFEAASHYQEQCDRLDAASVSQRRDILADWRYGNDQADYDRVMSGLTRQIPELQEQLESQSAALAETISRDLQRDTAQCDKLDEVLSDEQFAVRSSVRELLSLTRKLGIDIPDRPEMVPLVKTLEETEILPLATLSARLEIQMAQIGSKEGARELRNLRAAREEHAEARLEADGVQILFGRVTEDDELREWRDDMQSAFKARCRSFSEDAHEARMAASVGQDMVLVGLPRGVVDSTEGGTVTLNNCSLFTLEETGRPMVQEEDSAGLMLRPLEFSEAYAGPAAGIALNDVDRLIYDASFDTRLDGFGNGYVDRQEDLYVLLRDGTAYLHQWSFPFTDLAVTLSQHREPDRWFTWAERDGKITLTSTGGVNSGAEHIIETPHRLVPFDAQLLDAEYYYLQVGMGGARQDRRFAFSEDGAVRYSRGGFVAGNLGTSYIIVSGEDDPDTLARYRIEDFTLILENDGEVERLFLARPESTDRKRPDTLVIEGTAYWLDDEAGGE
ncbi:hypothetical protein SAMN05216456_1608 [Devosia crocina]|uniref:Uncharacterized protein n=1 Tax=Devosia crocina TaxID=429728 RepID=A0A1I7NCC4_9HYPH|nr:hypothetical protein SAMN05216456_1608 [Devosia crocina]